ncbi:hypothetical protein Golomagni_05216 [Golovinomyces magnicellulatus]|nr:hypothetical protein Golomagni_05216 [Golovinomyces magnicellulatus]
MSSRRETSSSDEGAGAAMGAIARIWRRSNAPDYTGVVILLAGWIVVGLFATPFHRMFYVNDLRISYPHAEHQRVPVVMNFVYALFVPLGVLAAYNVVRQSRAAKHEATYLALTISIVTACFITDVIKNVVGRPRPDFLARCQPDPKIKPNILVSIEACTAPDGHTLQDGGRSFPSGHSAFAFSGLGFVRLFFAGQLRIFKHDSGGRDLSRALFCLAPILGAALIAISRTEDYRHDVYDISVGSLIGMTVAYWSYRRHWPTLTSDECDEPYPSTASDNPPAWQQIRDEEQGGAESNYELPQYGQPSN